MRFPKLTALGTALYSPEGGVEAKLDAQQVTFSESEKLAASAATKARASEAVSKLKAAGRWVPAFDKLHLGEISLECSRAGAAAAALWLTLEVIPLSDAGLGQVLRANRRAALHWHGLLTDSDEFTAYQRPEIDIVTYLPRRASLSEVDRVSAALFVAAAQGEPAGQIHLATYNVKGADLLRRGHELELDRDAGRIMRSVVMKPESGALIDSIQARLEELARSV
jgi:glutamate/tyrosine decarboxylase-like PLP-dependent enzyme